ncbi:MAG: hypothetical protein ACKOKB_09145, partial [Bacteroidota bacterium]
ILNKQSPSPAKSSNPASQRIEDLSFQNLNVVARFVRIRTKGDYVCPSGHPGAGKPSWIFADEIMVWRK